MKKLIASLLTSALVLCLAPSAAASRTPDTFSHDALAQSAAEALNAAGIFGGVGTNPDGSTNFDLGRAPTRAESVALLVRLIGAEAEAQSSSYATPFTDMPDWAAGYIGCAYTRGLVNGVGENAFGDGPVTSNQFMTFVLRALGYVSGEDFAWDAPWALSDSIGLTFGEYNNASAFTRGDAAIVCERALHLNVKGTDISLLAAHGIRYPDEVGPETYTLLKKFAASAGWGLTMTPTGYFRTFRTDTGDGTETFSYEVDYLRNSALVVLRLYARAADPGNGERYEADITVTIPPVPCGKYLVTYSYDDSRTDLNSTAVLDAGKLQTEFSLDCFHRVSGDEIDLSHTYILTRHLYMLASAVEQDTSMIFTGTNCLHSLSELGFGLNCLRREYKVIYFTLAPGQSIQSSESFTISGGAPSLHIVDASWSPSGEVRFGCRPASGGADYTVGSNGGSASDMTVSFSTLPPGPYYLTVTNRNPTSTITGHLIYYLA